jgi:hypothetical protein
MKCRVVEKWQIVHLLNSHMDTRPPPPNRYPQRAPAGQFQHLGLLRLFLGLAALTWGIAVVGVFISWSVATQALEGLGAQAIVYDRMLEYWLRMAAGAFALIGFWYLILMIWPQKFHAAIPWFGGFMLVEGVILLVLGLRLAPPPFPFYGDVSACFIGGGAILHLSRYATPEHQRIPK